MEEEERMHSGMKRNIFIYRNQRTQNGIDYLKNTSCDWWMVRFYSG